MYLIQYKTGEREDFKGSRRRLVQHLTHSTFLIEAVYEQTTVVTKAVRGALSQLPLNTLSRAAQEFVSSRL